MIEPTLTVTCTWWIVTWWSFTKFPFFTWIWNPKWPASQYKDHKQLFSNYSSLKLLNMELWRKSFSPKLQTWFGPKQCMNFDLVWSDYFYGVIDFITKKHVYLQLLYNLDKDWFMVLNATFNNISIILWLTIWIRIP